MTAHMQIHSRHNQSAGRSSNRQHGTQDVIPLGTHALDSFAVELYSLNIEVVDITVIKSKPNSRPRQAERSKYPGMEYNKKDENSLKP